MFDKVSYFNVDVLYSSSCLYLTFNVVVVINNVGTTFFKRHKIYLD